MLAELIKFPFLCGCRPGLLNGKGQYYRGIPDGIVLQPQHNLNQVPLTQTQRNILCVSKKRFCSLEFPELTSSQWRLQAAQPQIPQVAQARLFSASPPQMSRIGSDDTYLLPDLLQKTSSSSSASPTHYARSHQQPQHSLSYSQSPTTPRSPTHQDLSVSLWPSVPLTNHWSVIVFICKPTRSKVFAVLL